RLQAERGRDRDGARSRRRRLPRAALPHASLDFAVVDPSCNLDVRPLREPRVRLEQRADVRQLVWVTVDHGVWIADAHGGEADAVDLLRVRDGHLAEVLLHQTVLPQLGSDLAWADPDRDDVAAVPARRDPRAVARHLGL